MCQHLRYGIHVRSHKLSQVHQRSVSLSITLGKYVILHLQGGIQAYVARDEIGVESYQDFKKMDIGDIVGIKGKVFATKTGEKSIHAEEVILLSKSLKPLPEKFHGLTDVETIYRKRYLAEEVCLI